MSDSHLPNDSRRKFLQASAAVAAGAAAGPFAFPAVVSASGTSTTC
jgi:hypothetical protein